MKITYVCPYQTALYTKLTDFFLGSDIYAKVLTKKFGLKKDEAVAFADQCIGRLTNKEKKAFRETERFTRRFYLTEEMFECEHRKTDTFYDFFINLGSIFGIMQWHVRGEKAPFEKYAEDTKRDPVKGYANYGAHHFGEASRFRAPAPSVIVTRYSDFSGEDANEKVGVEVFYVALDGTIQSHTYFTDPYDVEKTFESEFAKRYWCYLGETKEAEDKRRSRR